MFIPSVVFAGGGDGYVNPVNCGPYMDTYRVTSLGNVEGKGIRCVKFTDGLSLKNRKNNAPVFAWYGEGIWDTRTYRHIGQAFKSTNSNGDLVGYSTDIYGNGEYANGNFPGDLNIKIIDRNNIEVTGAWYEKWTKVGVMDHIWMPTPTVCGDNLTSYKVYGLEDTAIGKQGESGEGLRCELKIGKLATTWVGFGNWNGVSYSHLATKNTKGQIGSSDFCKVNEYCATKAYGQLKRVYSAALNGLILQGWSEIWIKM